jgi:hypothetical protein
MTEEGAYGETLRRTFKTETAPSFVSRRLKNAKVAVTEIRCDKEDTGLTEPIPVEDAFLVTVQLRDVAAHGLFVDGSRVRTEFLPAGTANIYDLRSSPIADSIRGFHHLSFYLPRAALLEVAELEGLPDADNFHHHPGLGVKDEVLHNLARAILTPASNLLWRRTDCLWTMSASPPPRMPSRPIRAAGQRRCQRYTVCHDAKMSVRRNA